MKIVRLIGPRLARILLLMAEFDKQGEAEALIPAVTQETLK